MDTWERDYHVSRIVAGRLLCRVGGLDLMVGTPGREARYLAAEVRRETARVAGEQGVFDAEEGRLLLVDRGLLEVDHAELHEKWTSDIREMKVTLFENYAGVDAREAVRRALAAARAGFAELCERRDLFYGMTAEAVAQVAQARFLVGASIRMPDGSAYWPDPWRDWGRPDDLIDRVVERMAEARLDESGVRELAREEPWATTWASADKSGSGVFGAASADLTDEQRGLAAWSRNYEAIREHPKCPSEAVMADDDALDGWLILRQRERESDQARTRLDGIRSEKIKNSQEVFLMAADAEDAVAIDRLNSPVAAHQKKQRMAHLKRHGNVNEMQMPDTMQRFQMAASQAASQAMKGGRR